VAEAVAVGRAGGLSDSELRDLLKNSPMLPPGLQNRFEGILTGQQEAWWSTVLGAKDAGLALDVARGTHVARPIAEVVHQLYDRAATAGDDAADIAAVARLYGVPHSAPSGTHR
jgi:3-hydroxyisobutyrate dehydrogenase